MTKYRIIRLPLPAWVKSASVMPIYQLDKKTIFFGWTMLHQFNARSFGEAYKMALAVLEDRNPDDDENNIMEFKL